MLIDESDLIHTVRILSRSVAQGAENEPVFAWATIIEVRGLVVPRSARINREGREYTAAEFLVLTAYARGVKEGQFVQCRDDEGAIVLEGEIVFAMDPNMIHDHLELTVRKGDSPLDV